MAGIDADVEVEVREGK